MSKLFELRHQLPKKTTLMIELAGLAVIILFWIIATLPQQTTYLRFQTLTGEQYQYKWSGADGFEENYKGDNILMDILPGEYNYSVSDSNNCTVTGTITVPTEINEPITNEIKKNCGRSDTEIEFYVKVSNEEDGLLVTKTILPAPGAVFGSFGELYMEKGLMRNLFTSLKLNILGYLLAIASALVLGFVIGLFPLFRSLLSRYIDAIRFIPLAAVTGLFIAWFGIDTNMKVQFLAFGIFVFLLPVVVQRIDEVEKTYTQTAYTLGASKWQIIRHVFWPHVNSRIIDDIRVLTAISWTYIIVAELVNTDGGGIGTMIFKAQRISRLDQVFALLVVIVIIGFLQDLFFVWLDKTIYPHKYKKSK